MESSDASKESEALAALRAASIPRLRAEQWTSSGAKAGLSEIARLRASLAVAQAVLVGVMATESGRDTTAALSRRTGMSGSKPVRQRKRLRSYSLSREQKKRSPPVR